MREFALELWLQFRLACPALAGWIANLMGWLDMRALTQAVLALYAVAQVAFLIRRWYVWERERKKEGQHVPEDGQGDSSGNVPTAGA